MIEPARTSSRARGRSATARTAAAMCVLADERDRVDADPLAAQVVPVGLADRAERDLGDLRSAADDDHPLAEHPVEAPREALAAQPGEVADRSASGRPRQAPRPRPRSRPPGRRRAPARDRRRAGRPERRTVLRLRSVPPASATRPIRVGIDRRRVVEGEPDGDGRRDGRAAVAATGHRSGGPRRRSAGRAGRAADVGHRHALRGETGARVVLLVGQAEGGERLAGRGRRRWSSASGRRRCPRRRRRCR